MKKILPLAITVTLFAIIVSPGFAATIRIHPHSSYYPEPTLLTSPATFSVNVTAGGDPTYNPHIFLVMTSSSYSALSGPVTVNWTETMTPVPVTFTGPETQNNKSLPTGVSIHSGTTYNVATLQDHLFADDEEEEAIWWAFAPILYDNPPGPPGNPITTTPQQFTVTLPSSSPRMLVYVLGEHKGNDEFDNRVPPTQPGLVVPELSEILLVLASFSAFILYATYRRRQLNVPLP